MSLSTYVSIYVCADVSICLCTDVPMSISAYVSICLCADVSICLSADVPMCLSAYESICLCVYLPMCRCAYVSICLCVYLPMCLCEDVMHSSPVNQKIKHYHHQPQIVRESVPREYNLFTYTCNCFIGRKQI